MDINSLLTPPPPPESNTSTNKSCQNLVSPPKETIEVNKHDHHSSVLPKAYASRPLQAPQRSEQVLTSSLYGNSPVSLLNPTTASPNFTQPLSHSQYYSSQEDSHDGSLRGRHSYQRSEVPPTDSNGDMICKDTRCTGKAFKTKSDWNKHMDKHERPYLCDEDRCKRLQGFTSSSGLNRHKVSVHGPGIHFCPAENCERARKGFARKDNPDTHIRRMHPEGISSQTSTSSERCLDTNIAGKDDLDAQVKWLRSVIKEKDMLIKELEKRIAETREDHMGRSQAAASEP